MEPAPTASAPANRALAGMRPGASQVALLLPLSGQQAPLGKAMLEAAQMALLETGQGNGGGIVLVPQDTGGTPEGAEAAARKAIGDGARLILGPLFSASVRAASGPARERGVPIVAFTNDADVAAPGVFILGLLPGPQIERVVMEAAAAGAKRFSVLAPASAYGQRGAQAAEEAVPRAGGSIVSMEFYDPSGIDAQETARRLARQPADIVVLPEGPPRAATLAPIYAYYETRGARARFVGTQLWEDPSMWREPALYGAWFAAPPADARNAFMERFQSLQGHAAPRIATLAYDATALASVLARRRGGPDFSVDAITQPNGFTGVEGLFRFHRDGLSERALAVMEIRRGSDPAVIRPAPATFEDRPS
jgi:ABC-type branched-subunit amino acid transport system substrate-binding protein